MTNPFSASLSPLQAPESLALDARPAALKRWIAALNLHDLGASTRQIYEQLQLTNRAELSARVRLDWLEALQLPLQTITTGLRSHYQNKPFPIAEKGMGVAHLANALHQEMMLAYRRLLASPPDTSLLGRNSDRQMRQIACYRLFEHSGEILCNHRLTYAEAPHGLWRHLHAYYARVRAQGWADTPIPGITPAATLSEQYRKLLLHTLLQSAMMPVREWHHIGRKMDAWARLVRLVDARERPAARTLYCIRFDLDAPTAAVTEQCCGACSERAAGVLFDTAPLVAELEQRLQAAAPHRGLAAINTEEPAQETLQMLLRSWRIPDAPREQRRAVDLPLTIVSGIEDIHAILTLEEGQPKVPAQPAGPETALPSYTIPDFTLADVKSKPVLSAFPDDAFLGQRDQEGDIWNTVYAGKEIEAPAPVWSSSTTQEKKVAPLNARAVDASATGYRLEMELPEQSGIRLGELIAVRGARIEGWELFLLRWLRRIDAARVTLGLQRIGDGLRAVDLLVQSKDASRAVLRAITALDDEMNPLLLMPLLPSLASKRLAIGDAGEERAITLADNLALSPLFESYLYVPSEAVAQRAAWLRAAKQPEKRSDDPFHELWTSL